MASYEFVTIWRLDAPIEDVYRLIDNPTDWPRWWPAVLDVREVDPAGPDGIGAVFAATMKGRLPYALRFEARVTVREPPTGLELAATGELEGTGTWALAEANGYDDGALRLAGADDGALDEPAGAPALRRPDLSPQPPRRHAQRAGRYPPGAGRRGVVRTPRLRDGVAAQTRRASPTLSATKGVHRRGSGGGPVNFGADNHDVSGDWLEARGQVCATGVPDQDSAALASRPLQPWLEPACHWLLIPDVAGQDDVDRGRIGVEHVVESRGHSDIIRVSVEGDGGLSTRIDIDGGH